MEAPDAFQALDPFVPIGAGALLLLWWMIGSGLLAFVGAAAADSVAGIALRRISADAHWTERARAGYPALVVSAGWAFAAPVMLAIVAIDLAHRFPAVPPLLLGLGAAFASGIGVLVVRRRTIRRASGLDLSLYQIAVGEWTGLVLRMPHLFLLLGMFLYFDSEFDRHDVVATVLFGLVYASFAHSGGLPILRALRIARPADPSLVAIVRETARRVGVDVRRVWTAPWNVANVVAFPWSRELVFTPRLLDVLGQDEIAAVTAHELGHLFEPTSLKVARSAAAFALFPIGLGYPIFSHWGAFGALACAALSLAMMIAAARRVAGTEQRADQFAHAHQSDEGSYARALAKIYEASGIPAVMPQKRPFHPHLFDRLVSAGVAPAYPRPKPPSRWLTTAGALVTWICSAMLIFTLVIAPDLAAKNDTDPGRARIWTILSANARNVHDLGIARVDRGEVDEGVAWLRIAHAVDQNDHHSGAYASELLAQSGNCGAARGLLEAAEGRVSAADLEDCEWIRDAHIALAECETDGSESD